MDEGAAADEGFSALFRREYPSILRTAYAVLGDGHAAQEVAQEAFARLYARWPQVRGHDRPGAWVRRVAIRVAVRHAQQHRPGPLDTGVSPATPVPGERAERVDLERSLLALSPSQRAAIVLHYLHDLPVADVAIELGCREPTARVHLHRARRRLAVLLMDDTALASGAHGGEPLSATSGRELAGDEVVRGD